MLSKAPKIVLGILTIIFLAIAIMIAIHWNNTPELFPIDNAKPVAQRIAEAQCENVGTGTTTIGEYTLSPKKRTKICRLREAVTAAVQHLDIKQCSEIPALKDELKKDTAIIRYNCIEVAGKIVESTFRSQEKAVDSCNYSAELLREVFKTNEKYNSETEKAVNLVKFSCILRSKYATSSVGELIAGGDNMGYIKNLCIENGYKKGIEADCIAAGFSKEGELYKERFWEKTLSVGIGVLRAFGKTTHLIEGMQVDSWSQIQTDLENSVRDEYLIKY